MRRVVTIWQRPLCFVDVETTGLNVFLGHELIQIGAVLANPISLNVVGEFERKVILDRPEKEDPGARKFNFYDPAVWTAEAIPATSAVREFGEFALGATIFGQNVSFDASFIKELATRVSVSLAEDYGIDYHFFDLATLAYVYLAPYGLEGKIDGVNLSKVAKFLGLSPFKEHDALSDARASLEVYAALRRRFAVIDLAGS